MARNCTHCGLPENPDLDARIIHATGRQPSTPHCPHCLQYAPNVLTGNPYGFFNLEQSSLLATWGCRAILGRDSSIDFVYNRQGAAGDAADQEALLAWLNAHGTSRLTQIVKEHCLDVRSHETLAFQEYRYILKASPRASHGYLYVGAALLKVTEGEEKWNTAAQAYERRLHVGDDTFYWAGNYEVPAIGTVGLCKRHASKGTVIGYHTEDAYEDGHLLTLRINVEKPAKWWLDQRYADACEKAQRHGRLKPLKKAFMAETREALVWDGDFQPDPVPASV